MNLLKKLFQFAIFSPIFAGAASLAQTPATSLVDLNRVSPVVKKRFLDIGADQFTSLDQFTTSISAGETLNPEGYHYNSMKFEIDAPLEKVWQAYLTSNPKDTWSGKTIRFDFAYSKPNNDVYYRDSAEVPTAHVGMGFYIVLNVYRLKKLPASLEITKIDEKEKVFEYTYLTTNTAQGRQSIRLSDLGNGRTGISHVTYFKSLSKFRDQYLYPPIHEALLEEFHQNVMNLLHVKAIRTE